MRIATFLAELKERWSGATILVSSFVGVLCCVESSVFSRAIRSFVFSNVLENQNGFQ